MISGSACIRHEIRRSHQVRPVSACVPRRGSKPTSGRRYPDWASKYIDYSALKKQLKRKPSAEWDDADEQGFIAALQEQLSKIYKFQEETMADIWEQLRLHEGLVKDLMDRSTAYHDEEHGEDTDEEDVQEENEAKFAEIEADLETLIWETHEISARFGCGCFSVLPSTGKYTQINFTGFQKITKVSLLWTVCL
jgi:SPX domain protein involved in polyphosphate accumulation